MATITQTQVASSYHFSIKYEDSLAQLLKVVVEDSGNSEIYSNENLETDITYIIDDIIYPDTYTVYYYLWDSIGSQWVQDASETIEILEYQIEVLWSYTVGNNYQIDPNQTYTYFPSYFKLNDNVPPTPPNYSPEITFTLYDLIDEQWEIVDSDTRDLSGWDDENPDTNLITYEYTTRGYPLKIITQVSNSFEIITNDTYVDQEFLITSIDAVNAHSEIQGKASYTVTFNYSFGNEDGTKPNLIITPENNSYTKCNVFIYKNGEVIHTYEGLTPLQMYPYTFAQPTTAGTSGAQYEVKYVSTDGVDFFQEIFPFTVKEYKPTFNIPTIQCLKINEPANITLGSLRFNCFAEDEILHYATNPDFTPNINYKLYYLNPNNYTWEPFNGDTMEEYSGVDTPNLMTDVDDYFTNNPDNTDTQVSTFLAQKYRFGSSDTQNWTPNKLTMVKLVATVTNYTTSVMKETIFPICGSWKIRRMACGIYRIYNYTESEINFIISRSENSSFVFASNLQVPPLSFSELKLSTDGIYKVSGGILTKYIFNFCDIESCILELQKKVLLDDTLCDACKLDKVLYQKALRLIPIYETWKKLLDKDWVYEIQYQSTDPNQSLAALYDAEELYLELKDLCDNCTYSSEKCNCK